MLFFEKGFERKNLVVIIISSIMAAVTISTRSINI